MTEIDDDGAPYTRYDAERDAKDFDDPELAKLVALAQTEEKDEEDGAYKSEGPQNDAIGMRCILVESGVFDWVCVAVLIVISILSLAAVGLSLFWMGR